MKKQTLLLVLPLLLAGCNTTSQNSTNNPTSSNGQSSISDSSRNDTSSDKYSGSSDKISSIPDSSTSSDSSSTSTGSEVSNPNLELKMFGDLFAHNSRSIYALLHNGTTGNVVFESSNTDIVRVSTSENQSNLPEALLIAVGEGVVTIKAYLEDNPEIYSTKILDTTVTGLPSLSSTVYDSLKSSVKLNSVDQRLNFDANYDSSIAYYDEVETIFEESEAYNDELYGSRTDNYSIRVTQDGKETFNRKYVRSGRYVCTEYVDVNNEISTERVLTEEGEDINWFGSYYYNFLGYEDYFSASSFVSKDNGQTYHYVGGYLYASYLAANFFLVDISPDDIYLTVSGDNVTMTFIIDPYNSEDNATVKYGRKITTTFSERGTAKIDHLQPYEHVSYHDSIDTAKTNMAQSKNYQLTYTVDYSGDLYDSTYVYTYTADTIDIQLYQNKSLVGHTGVHKVSDTYYYEYSYDETSKVVTITKKHEDAAWEDSSKNIVRYPTFDFASEIFEQSSSNELVFNSRSKNGIFVRYCAYMPGDLSYAEFDDDGSLTLTADKTHIESISTTGTDYSGSAFSFAGTFSQFGEASVDLDFDSAVEDSKPTSWAEENETLYEDMVAWNLPSDLPYLYAQNGFTTSVYHIKDANNANGVKYAYLDTYAFSSADKRDEYVTEYKKLLVNAGYQLTTETGEHDYPLYQKGDYKVAVGAEYNSWNGMDNLRTIIYIYSDKLVYNY